MAYDKLVDSAQLDATFTGIADAIRANTGSEEKISQNDMAKQIPLVYNAGHTQGFLDGYVDGRAHGLVEGYTKGQSDGIEQGRNEYWNTIWDAIQLGGTRTTYNGAFANTTTTFYWNEHSFKPKYDLKPIGSASTMFDKFGGQASTTPGDGIDLADLLDKAGVVLDTSKATAAVNFAYNSMINHMPEINATGMTAIQGTFGVCSKLKKIDKLVIREDGTNTFGGTFQGNYSLEDIVIEGVIGNAINFAQSSKLSNASINSIINALKDLTGATAKTLTLHADVGNKLTEAQKETIAAKNWTLVY